MAISVSVLVPCFDAAGHVEKTVRSALAQTRPPLEILCVDDGSRDATWEILRRLAAESPIVKAIRHSQNRGLSAARNTAMENATGEWFALLDSDDLWLPEKLERQLGLLDSAPEAALLHGEAFAQTDDDPTTRRPLLRSAVVRDQDPIATLFAGNWVICPTAMFRREWAGRLGGFRSHHGVAEDADFWMRMALDGATFAHTGEPIAVYRKHGENMSGDEVKMPRGRLSCLERNLLDQPEVIGRIGRESFEAMQLYYRLGIVRGLLRRGDRELAEKEWGELIGQFGAHASVAGLKKSLWPLGLRHRKAEDRLRREAKALRQAVLDRL